MRVIDPGHRYKMRQLDDDKEQDLVFVRRGTDKGEKHPGVQNQEVLRVLIDRVQFLDGEKRWEGNDKIIHHLRMALALHESRAIERKVEKGDVLPEKVCINPFDGHFFLEITQ